MATFPTLPEPPAPPSTWIEESGVQLPAKAAGRLSGALVMGGAHGSLGVVRSLGRRGVPVWVLVGDHPIAGFSRFTKRHFTWPGPDSPNALEYILRLAQEHDLRGWVLFPGGDAEARFIALHHAELAKVFRLTTPPWETLQWAGDKRLTYQLAEGIGVDHPYTIHARGRDDLAEIRGPFPLILKPAVHNPGGAFRRAKAWRVDDASSLLARYDEAVSSGGPESVVVQELIPGNGSCQYSYAAVCDHGVPVASLVAVRRRQYPIDFGFTSTFVRSTDAPKVEELARRFLQASGYSGMVELEFKYDNRDDRYKLLDVNARTWTWLALGAKAGVDFPWVTWNLAMGEPMGLSRGRVDCAWVHMARDAVAAVSEICAGSLTFSEFVNSFRGASLEFAAFSKDDPLPGMLDLPLTLWRLWDR